MQVMMMMIGDDNNDDNNDDNDDDDDDDDDDNNNNNYNNYNIGETKESAAYKSGRVNIGFKYNLFNHIGKLSVS